jgi:histidyl-tRNA synthetase
VVEILDRAGLTGFQLLMNSVGCRECRPKFIAELRERLAEVAPQMCKDCQRRAVTNPLRVLDCKVPEDQPIINGLPSILDHLCEACRTHFEAVKSYLDDSGTAFVVRPRLVRGLDYYTRTTFEIVHGSLGAQNSVLGGGRYDGLAEELGSKVAAPGIGFSIGEDRLVMTLEETRPAEHAKGLDVYLAPLGEAALRHSTKLARELRRAGVSTELGTDSKLKRSLETASKQGARFALIVGDNEIASGRYALKNLGTGQQENRSLPEIMEQLTTK